MLYESLGHLPRAPLVYSLAMIEYATVPSIAEHADSIMERLRGEYPDIREFKISSLNVEVDAATGESKAHQSVSTQWRMNNPDSNFGFVFGADRLVIHTSVYEHFEGFAEKIRGIAAIVFEVAKIKYTKSIGIRQIDNIHEIDQLKLSDLVKSGYLCPKQNNELTPVNSRVEFIYKSKLGRLFVRAYQLANHPAVPQDLFPLANELSSDNELMTPVTNTFILADTDHIYSPSKLEEFNLERVISILDSLHQQCSLGFREMVTAEAINAWKREIKDE